MIHVHTALTKTQLALFDALHVLELGNAGIQDSRSIFRMRGNQGPHLASTTEVETCLHCHGASAVGA
jgi:hypothetical protein